MVTGTVDDEDDLREMDLAVHECRVASWIDPRTAAIDVEHCLIDSHQWDPTVGYLASDTVMEVRR